MKGKRQPGIERVKDILPKSIHALGPAVEQRYLREYVVAHWETIVGKMIATSVEAVRILRDVLWLYSPDAVWRNQIKMMETDICQRVNNFAGGRLVRELRFARSGRVRRAIEAAPVEAEENGLFSLPEERLARQVQQADLKEEEIAQARAACAGVEDDELRARLFRLTLGRWKLQHVKEAHGYHRCADCSALCPPGAKRCGACAAKHEAELRAACTRLLREVPWMRYGEVKKSLPEATPALLARCRVSLIQSLASRVLLKDYASMEAKTLTMLFRCLPPEQLTEDLVKRTLYYLRGNLAKPEDWQPLRRYDYISWGRKKAGERRVPTSRQKRVRQDR